MSRTEIDALRERLFDSFRRAENAVKAAEHAGEPLPVPCINELRYAGFHHIASDKALSRGDVSSALEEMRKAVRHARRAEFDVAEFYIAVYSEAAKDVMTAYKGYEYLAARHIPDYARHVRTLNAIGDLLDNTHVLDKESADYSERCYRICRELKAFIDAYRSVEPALLSEIADKEAGKRLSWRQCALGIFGGALVGVLAGWLFGKFLG